MHFRGLTHEEIADRKACTLQALQPDSGSSYESEKSGSPTSHVAEEPAHYGIDRPSDGAFRLFAIASQDWYRKMSELQVAADLGRYAALQELREELVTHRYVTIHRVKTGDIEKSIKILLPTRLGRLRLREANVKFMQVVGDAPHGPDGDATHIYYQNKIARQLEANGWATEIEMALREKRVDVGAIRGPARHAYEVVNVDLDKELSNLTKDVEEGWQRVVFCVLHKEVESELAGLITTELGSGMLEPVEFRLLASFR